MTEPDKLAVLASGGADSAILVADRGRDHIVQPIYVRFGLAWEEVEEAHLRRFLNALPDDGNVRPLKVFELPVGEIYGSHWSVSGSDVPDETTSDEAVYLPGRNMLLLAKTSVWCALNGVTTVALGTLQGNPFGDSSPEFFAAFATMSERALAEDLEIITPFAGKSKADVLDLGRDLPLEHTFSCIAPVAGGHCGRCNKCAERRKGFADAGIADATPYATN